MSPAVSKAIGSVESMMGAAFAAEFPDRKQVLSSLQSSRAQRGYDQRLSSRGMLGLLRLAASETGGMYRRTLLSDNNQGERMTLEDARWLISRGFIIETGAGSKLEITDKGNALARKLLAVALEFEDAGWPNCEQREVAQ